MITIKFTAILAIAAMLALSPFMTMTALAVKGDFGGSNNNKHFGGGNSKQITHSVGRHLNNNNGFKGKGGPITIHHNDNNNNFNNFKHNDNDFNFKHNDNFRFNNHDNGGFRFHNDNHHNDNFFRFHNDNHNHDNNHRTVIVHDNHDNERTIVIATNLVGTCFVTQSEIVNIPNITQQLLDQCVSVTIIQG